MEQEPIMQGDQAGKVQKNNRGSQISIKNSNSADTPRTVRLIEAG